MTTLGGSFTTAGRSTVLGRAAAEAVALAAGEGRAVVVPHQAPADAVPDAATLRDIAATLPPSWWRAVRGAQENVTCLPPTELAHAMPGDAPEAIVTRLYHMQEIPQFRAFIGSVYDEIEGVWPANDPWERRDAGFFLSSEGAVTASHADGHHNLLLQIAGSKEVAVATPGGRDHARIVARSMPSLRCDDMPPGAEVFRLEAGSALYIPAFSVHWVRSAEGSVALSCGWRTAGTDRAREVHAANSSLLRLKLPVQPVGRRTDATKVRAVNLARRLRNRKQPDC
jgi:hypothetical protein